MKRTLPSVLVITILSLIYLSGCAVPKSETGSSFLLGEAVKSTVEAINSQATYATASVPDQNPQITSEADIQRDVALGPENFPEGVNPLTGLLEEDVELLKLPPALVSITNFPPSARKIQGGLSGAVQVYEVYVGEGMTRFLAVFYGSYPRPKASMPNQSMAVQSPTSIGPIRSGRTVYESIRAHLNGFLIMASADKNVRSQLSNVVNYFGSDSDDINSSMIEVSKLKEMAASSGKSISVEQLSGNVFSMTVPAEGTPAKKLWVFYNILDQALWEYQPDLGGYYRYQDNADESGEFTLMLDAFTGQPLLYENVIVLFADHDFIKPTLININLDYIFQGKALLFRDGYVYPIYWTTRAGDYEQTTGLIRPIRYTNYYNEAFHLKPGQTWIHLVDINHRYWEADPSRPFESLAGSEFWAVRFYDPTQNPN